MNKAVLYVSYDSFEYRNYYHLIYNGSIAEGCSYLTDDELDQLFRQLREIAGDAGKLEIYIVQNPEAEKWDWPELFRRHQLLFHQSERMDAPAVKEMLRAAEYGDVLDSLNVISGSITVQDSVCDTQEALQQAQKILEHGGEDMTELARIIREKYERMSNE